MESFATGLKRIKAACDEAGCKVEFRSLEDGFVVVFYRRSNGAMSEKDINSLISDERMSELMSELRDDKRGTAIKQLLEYLVINDTITTSIGVEVTGKSEQQVRRYLKWLSEFGIIKKSKTTKGNVYKKVVC